MAMESARTRKEAPCPGELFKATEKACICDPIVAKLRPNKT